MCLIRRIKNIIFQAATVTEVPQERSGLHATGSIRFNYAIYSQSLEQFAFFGVGLVFNSISNLSLILRKCKTPYALLADLVWPALIYKHRHN